MKLKPDRAMAEGQAAEVVKRYQISTLPVELHALGAACEITIQAAPSTTKGVSGLLVRSGNAFGILYATHISSEGFQRFSIGHELGHYFLPGHVDAILPKDGMHESRAGFQSDNPYELEADHFAAALLMPDPMFKNALLKADDGLAGIEYLAALCKTSLPATAIRYVERASIPAAIIQTNGERVDFCFMSKAMQDFADLEWPRKGSMVPAGTVTERFNIDPQNIATAQRMSGTTTLRDWFGFRLAVEIAEEVVGLGSYGKTLTVLTSESFADEVSEEDALEESWKPKFAYGR